MVSKLSFERVNELLQYDPVSGTMTWRVTRGGSAAIGAVAGSPNQWGLWRVTIDRRRYSMTRVIWLMMTGDWPTAEVDHRDTDRRNNAWSNLRSATRVQNEGNKRPYKNNKTGLKGVSSSGQIKKPYRAAITVDKRSVFLGTFTTAEEAHEAYMKAAIERFGEFARAA